MMVAAKDVIQNDATCFYAAHTDVPAERRALVPRGLFPPDATDARSAAALRKVQLNQTLNPKPKP